MLKIKKKMIQTTIKLKNKGIEYRREFIAIYKPLFLEINLKGRRILKIRKILALPRFLFDESKLINDSITMRKSKIIIGFFITKNISWLTKI